MVVVAAVERVARCQMPRKAANSAIETTAARKRREEVMGITLSPVVPAKRRDRSGTSPRRQSSMKTCYTTHPAQSVPAFAATAASEVRARPHDAFLILKLAR